MKTYNNVKYNKQDGVLKIDRKKGRLVFDASSSSCPVDVSWDLVDFQRNKLKTTLDGERHFIKLIFKEGNDAEEYQEVFQLTTREGIEQLGKDLRRAKRMTVPRMMSDRPATAAASAGAARNNESPNSQWPTAEQQTAPDQDPPSAVPVTSHDVDVEQPIPVSRSPRDPPPPFNPDYNAGSGTAGMRLEDLPTATATLAEPDIEVEATVPIVTEVILLPFEYDEDEVEDSHHNPQEEADAEPEIEISPRSERVASALQFWDRRNHANPKRGDHLRDDGWPNGWIIFLYLAACSMLGCIIYYSVIDDGYYSIPGLVFLGPFIFFYIAFMCVSCGGCCTSCPDNAFQYLQYSMTSREVETLLKRYIWQRPEVKLHVRCWHEKTTYDKEGRSSKAQVTSFSQDYPVPLVRSGDCTEVANGDIDLHEYKLTKVKLQKSLVPDQNFLDRKKQLYEHNKHRDKFCDVTEKMDLPGFLPHMLCIAAGREKPYYLNPEAFALAHLLLVPSLPYRLWMGYITGKVRLEIRKEITTEPVGESCICCGHQN